MALPVEKLRGSIIETLKRERRLVFTSPPGSGKSTLIPQFLEKDLELDGQVVVLQPRRLAARSLAHSVAKMTGENVGERVGYQVRGESRQGKSTRISYRTVGLLLRQMGADFQLEGISAVIIDEFHERSWQSDVILTLLRELQKVRDDFYLVVMSATMEASRVCQYLGGCSLLESDLKPYPIDMFYRPFGRQVKLWERAEKTVKEHLEREPSGGDILVFMPGQFEIRKTMEALQTLKKVKVLALYGSLPADKQDEALQKSPSRKIIVSTNIAETSLTVEGVDTVIDGGFSRENIYDAARGLDTLSLQSIAVFSAEQRSGRAGRLGPGTAYRLWSREEHERKPLNSVPEIARIDTSEVLLALLAMDCDLVNFEWFTAPDSSSINEGMSLLEALGAVEDGRITDAGRAMAHFPAHPRLAAMLLTAAANNCYDEACRWAAIVSERSPLDKSVKLIDDRMPASDLRAVANVWMSYNQTEDKSAFSRRYKVHRGTVRTLNQVFKQFNSLLKSEDNFEDDENRLALAVLRGFPDKLARRLDRGTLRYRFANGKVGELTRNSAVRDSEFIVPLSAVELNNSGQSKIVFSQAVEIDYSLIEELAGDRLHIETKAVWNEVSRIVELCEVSRLGEFILREKTLSEAPGELAASEILVEKVLKGELKLNQWNKDLDNWIKRTRWVAALFPEKELLTYSEEEQQIILLEMCSGSRSYKDIKNLPVLDYFKNALDWQEQNFIVEMTPEKIKLQSGRNMKLSYAEDGAVKGSGFIQDFYGMTTTPTVAGGRVKVLLDMLAPNRRTVHLTDDLEGFWDGVYKDIKSQLAGRYPKHKWI